MIKIIELMCSYQSSFQFNRNDIDKMNGRQCLLDIDIFTHIHSVLSVCGWPWPYIAKCVPLTKSYWNAKNHQRHFTFDVLICSFQKNSIEFVFFFVTLKFIVSNILLLFLFCVRFFPSNLFRLNKNQQVKWFYFCSSHSLRRRIRKTSNDQIDRLMIIIHIGK